MSRRGTYTFQNSKSPVRYWEVITKGITLDKGDFMLTLIRQQSINL